MDVAHLVGWPQGQQRSVVERRRRRHEARERELPVGRVHVQNFATGRVEFEKSIQRRIDFLRTLDGAEAERVPVPL